MIIYLVFLILFIICILYLYNLGKRLDKKSNIVSKASITNLYLVSVHNYDYSKFGPSLLQNYKNRMNNNQDWKNALQLAMIDTYHNFFNVNELPGDVNTWLQSIYNTPIFAKDTDPIVNQFFVISLVQYIPTVLASYFYTYKIVDITKSYYIKNIPVKTIKNAFDLAIQLTKSFYGNNIMIQTLDNIKPSSFSKDISTIPFPGLFYSPVSYTYFDPMDIYLHPNRYTINNGIGIMDSTQPTYTLYVEKDQLQYLNQLLKDSSNNLYRSNYC
jgi:hypothetical protein